jgi:hypothetical protein
MIALVTCFYRLITTSRLGYDLQLLGMIREKQVNRTESFDLYRRALVNWKATKGLSHPGSGHVLVELAEEMLSKFI